MSGLLLILLVVLVLATSKPHHCEKCCPGKSRRQLRSEVREALRENAHREAQAAGRTRFAHFWLKTR